MSSSDTLYGLTIRSLQGDPVSLGAYAGHPLLIVNTASKCSFTPQLGSLQSLWQRHRDSGLVVIGVPSNDFGGQEPGTAEEIAAFCQVTYGVDFPMMAKSQVRGEEAHPLFRWLAAQGGFFSRPRWNFYKYLIDKEGRLKGWYSSLTAPATPRFGQAIERLLARS